MNPVALAGTMGHHRSMSAHRVVPGLAKGELHYDPDTFDDPDDALTAGFEGECAVGSEDGPPSLPGGE